MIITAPGLEKKQLLHLVNKIQLKVKNVIFVPDLIGISVGNISIDSFFNEKVVMLRIDIVILIKTVKSVLKKEGVY